MNALVSLCKKLPGKGAKDGITTLPIPVAPHVHNHLSFIADERLPHKLETIRRKRLIRFTMLTPSGAR